jgi:hypothetical protein
MLERMATRPLSIATALVAGVLLAGPAGASPTLDQWVAANASPAEKTLCTREERGEFFFVALSSQDRVRVGSRVDMTGYKETHEFGVAWIIGNERAASIVAKVEPTTIRERYVKEGSRIYADNVYYQTLKPTESKLFRVDAQVHKCAVWSPGSNTCASGRKAYTVKVCDTKL